MSFGGPYNTGGRNFAVAKAWAAQSKPGMHGSNFYFNGERLYSYGSHFCVAEIIKNKRGETAALFNPRKYSVTTSRHQSYARQAWGDRLRLAISPDLRPSNAREWFTDQATALYRELAGTRKLSTWRGEHRREAYTRAIQEANSYALFMGMRWRLKEQPTDADALRAFLKRERIKAARSAAKQQREIKRMIEAQNAAHQAWLAFEPEGRPHTYGPIALRASLIDKSPEYIRVDTSKHASAEFTRYALQELADALDGSHSPIVLGAYRFEFGPDHVRVGCHLITKAEVRRLLATVGIA